MVMAVFVFVVVYFVCTGFQLIYSNIKRNVGVGFSGCVGSGLFHRNTK